MDLAGITEASTKIAQLKAAAAQSADESAARLPGIKAASTMQTNTAALNTAGTHDHSLRIKGLPVAQAHALRAELLPRTRSQHE